MRPLKKRLGKRNVRGFRIAVIFLITAILLVLVDGQIRPMIRAAASYQASIYATELMNDAVSRALDNKNSEEFVDLIHDQENNVTSVSINMVAVNQLKTTVTAEILKKLDQNDERIVEVPLGTLLGSELFSGRGSKVPITLSPMGLTDIQMNSGMRQAGINQVLHEVSLSIEVEVSAILPGYTTGAKVHSDYLIAQTVIVGDVPKGYASIDPVV